MPKGMTLTSERQARVAAWEQEQLDQYATSGMPPWAVAEYGDYLRGLPWVDDLGNAQWEVMDFLLTESSNPEPERGVVDRYVAALRTWKTATILEQAEVLGNHLGVATDYARRMIEEAGAGRVLDDGNACALYRHYDSTDALLYVGIALDPAARSEQHRTSSRWHRFSARMEVEWFDSREDAASEERGVIEDEFPIFNQTHNKKARDRAVAYLFDQLGEVIA